MDFSDGPDMEADDNITFTPSQPAQHFPMAFVADEDDRMAMLAQHTGGTSSSRRGHKMSVDNVDDKVRLAHAKFFNQFEDDLDESDMAPAGAAAASASAAPATDNK